MQLFSSRKEKETFLIQILWKLNIEQNEREIYIISLEILDDTELDIFFQKIYLQVMDNHEIKNEIEKKTIAPLSASII